MHRFLQWPINSWKTHCVKRIDWMTRCEIVWWRDVLFHLIRRNMVRRIGQGPATDGEPDNRPDFSLPSLYIIVGPSVYYSCSPQITNGINIDIVHLPCKLVVQLVMQTPRLATTTSTLYSSKSSSLASRCIRYGFVPCINPPRWNSHSLFLCYRHCMEWFRPTLFVSFLSWYAMRPFLVACVRLTSLSLYTQNCCASCKVHLVHTRKTTTETTFTSAVVNTIANNTE